VDMEGDRSLTLQHFQHRRRPLSEDSESVVRHLAQLWGFTVTLQSLTEEGEVVPVCACEVERSPRGAVRPGEISV